MPDSVSELIYEIFFERLSRQEAIHLKTIEMLKELFVSGRLANKADLARLAQQMEVRHAQDQQHKNQ